MIDCIGIEMKSNEGSFLSQTKVSCFTYCFKSGQIMLCTSCEMYCISETIISS